MMPPRPAESPLPRKGDAHEQANGGGAVLRQDHVSHQRLGDANDSRGKAAGQDACRHQRGQARRQRADQGTHGKPSHDDAQQPHAPHAVSDGAAHRLQRAVGHQVRGQDDRHHGRRHGKRLGYGRKRRRDKPVVRRGDEPAKAKRQNNASLLRGHACTPRASAVDRIRNCMGPSFR